VGFKKNSFFKSTLPGVPTVHRSLCSWNKMSALRTPNLVHNCYVLFTTFSCACGLAILNLTRTISSFCSAILAISSLHINCFEGFYTWLITTIKLCLSNNFQLIHFVILDGVARLCQLQVLIIAGLVLLFLL